MDKTVVRAVRYLETPGELASDLERILWEDFAAVFTDPCVMDSNLATTFAVAHSAHHEITWTMVGNPTVFGTKFEQGAFAAAIFRINDALKLARIRNPTALLPLSPETLNKFAAACMLVRSGVENSSPQLGSLRNSLLGQIEVLRQLIALETLDRNSMQRVQTPSTKSTETELSLDGPDESLALSPVWSEADRDRIRDTLSGQQLKLFNVLWDFNSATPDRWKYYGDLKAIRAEKIWRGQRDPDEIPDGTVFEALRKLQKKNAAGVALCFDDRERIPTRETPKVVR